MEKVGRWLGGPRTAVPAGSLCHGQNPVASLTCSIPQHSAGEAQLRTLCQAAVSPKAKTAQGPSLKRHRRDGNVPAPLLSSQRVFMQYLS